MDSSSSSENEENWYYRKPIYTTTDFQLSQEMSIRCDPTAVNQEKPITDLVTLVKTQKIKTEEDIAFFRANSKSILDALTEGLADMSIFKNISPKKTCNGDENFSEKEECCKSPDHQLSEESSVSLEPVATVQEISLADVATLLTSNKIKKNEDIASFRAHAKFFLDALTAGLTDVSILNERWCKYCNSVFTSDTKLFDTHHCENNPNRLECTWIDCQIRGFCKSNLRSHVMTHIQQKYSTTNSLQQDSNFQLPHRCKVCSQSFKLENDLANHVSSLHPKEICFKCDQCPMAFGTKQNLARHISLIHLKEKPFKCDQCPMAFGTKSNLASHISCKHLKEKPFKCDQCPMAFGTKPNLASHISLIHLKEKPFKCDQCPMAFGTKQNLASHISCKHLKEKPFKCDQCPMAFGTKSNLASHISCKHLKEKPFKCDQCPMAFGKKTNLASHISYKHTRENDESGR